MTNYPKQKETLRPFRLYDGRTSTQIPHRYYRWRENSHNGATLIMRWAKVGVTIEVVDVVTGKMLAQYTRERTGIRIHRSRSDTGY